MHRATPLKVYKSRGPESAALHGTHSGRCSQETRDRTGEGRQGDGGGRDVFHLAVGYACLFHNVSEKSVLIIYYFLIILVSL